MLYDRHNSDAPPSMAYTKKYDPDATGKILYEGWAQGSRTPLTSQAVWAIKKYTYDGNGYLTDEQWAGGKPDETNIWDNRAALTYK